MLSNCPPVVLQDDDIDCRCDTSGSPPAAVTWYGSSVINYHLTLRNVSRSLDGQNFTCNQYWGKRTSIWRSTTYSLQVHCESTFQHFLTSFCSQYCGGFSGSNWRTWTRSPVKCYFIPFKGERRCHTSVANQQKQNIYTCIRFTI